MRMGVLLTPDLRGGIRAILGGERVGKKVKGEYTWGGMNPW